MVQHSRDAEVSELHHTTTSEEDILTFDISVQDLPIMDVFEPETYLCEPV